MPDRTDRGPASTRLLVIEPDRALREALAGELSRHWPTSITPSASNGLGIASWYRPTVVIFEMFEAGMAPSTFVTLLEHGRPDEVLLLGTAAASQAEAARATPDIDAVFVKPFDIADLVREIEQRIAAAS